MGSPSGGRYSLLGGSSCGSRCAPALVATTLGEQGVHPEVSKTILGHSSSAMTAYYISFNKRATAAPLQQVSEVFHGDAVRADEFFNGLAGGVFTMTPEEEEEWSKAYQSASQEVGADDDWTAPVEPEDDELTQEEIDEYLDASPAERLRQVEG